jgi:hypothetical protein
VLQHYAAEVERAGSVGFPVAIQYLEAEFAHLLSRLAPESTGFINLLTNRLDCVAPDNDSFAAEEELTRSRVATPVTQDCRPVLVGELQQEVWR